MEDLTGKQFGRLTVQKRGGDRNGKRYWICRCICGNTVETEESHLKSGHTKSCGCYRREYMKRVKNDLSGRYFGYLKVLERAGTEKNRTTWRCRCQCGKEITTYGTYLVNGITRSCGCLQEESRKKNMEKAIHFIDGTCVEKLQVGKKNRNNTSGYPGVHQRKNGRWRAEIMFQGKRHSLGSYDSLEDAWEARREAENQLWRPFLENYHIQNQQENRG